VTVFACVLSPPAVLFPKGCCCCCLLAEISPRVNEAVGLSDALLHVDDAGVLEMKDAQTDTRVGAEQL
jgi:hypothetical protein